MRRDYTYSKTEKKHKTKIHKGNVMQHQRQSSEIKQKRVRSAMQKVKLLQNDLRRNKLPRGSKMSSYCNGGNAEPVTAFVDFLSS